MPIAHLREKTTTLASRYLNPNSSIFWCRLRKELDRWKRFFDDVERFPLTQLQREAIILDEKRNLVVAGAGTGKTATLTGKVGYLVKSGKAEPNEILLLAYNVNAVEEMKGRIKGRLDMSPDVMTFHGLGNAILRETSGRTRVSDFATQPNKYTQFLERVLNGIVKNPTSREKVTRYFAEALVPYRDTHREFDTLEEYSAWVRNNDLVTLAGERVKSFGELLIANHLFVSGVPYSYESWFKPRKKQKGNPVYRPDFHVTGTDAYIEYFGVDEHGRTAPYVNRIEYNEQMRWKRRLHRESRTILLEVQYHQVRDNNWRPALDEQLHALGIEKRPLSAEEVIRAANKGSYRSRLLSLVATFLPHFKANGLTISGLKNDASGDPRALTFLDIFEDFFEAYQDHLKSRGEIDFIDMIQHARQNIEAREFHPPWKYILVDEFQDISTDRYMLLDAILQAQEGCKLFCVGDDWQSIYRFAGSDISLMTQFAQFFGRSHVVHLDTTFRFNSQLGVVSEDFIQRNPRQIKKSLKSIKKADGSAVDVFWSSSEPPQAALEAARALLDEAPTSDATLQVLARYNHDLPAADQLQELRRIWPGEVLPPKSCHASKGLEADYVIVTDVISGRYGFPSEQQDDPLLGLVLASKESFLYAEERRLLYVGLTRAREKAVLVSNPGKPSEFCVELLKNPKGVSESRLDTSKTHLCPTCESGRVVPGTTAGFRCSNHPVCNFRAAICPECDEAPLQRTIDHQARPIATCSNSKCTFRHPVCPACSGGILLKKSGRHGDFWACHLFATSGCKGVVRC